MNHLYFLLVKLVYENKKLIVNLFILNRFGKNTSFLSFFRIAKKTSAYGLKNTSYVGAIMCNVKEFLRQRKLLISIRSLSFSSDPSFNRNNTSGMKVCPLFMLFKRSLNN